jgi:hypothetical protein
MKKITLLVALLYCITCQAQNSAITIKGTVIDSVKNEPLGFVTVILKDAATKQPVKTVLTKDNGTFTLINLNSKAYLLSFAYVSFTGKTIAIVAGNDKSVIELGKISLSPSNSQLKEVSVTADRPVLKQEVDRISYDAQADPESKAQSALDMMRKVPVLSVDANDNIKLKGSGNYKILINGKESAMVAKNPSDVLKAMPATNIEKIEVITTPPAKYDAEGLAGIINIITKKNADEGYSGNINSRFNSVWGPGINIRGTAKQGKLGASGYVGYYSNGSNHAIGFGNLQTGLSNNNSVAQNGTNTFGGHGNYGNVELSYELDTLNLLSSSFEVYHGINDQGSQQISNSFSNSIITNQFSLINNGNNTYTGLDASLNYQLGFKKSKDQLLTFSYKYSYSPYSQFNYVDINNTIFQQGYYQPSNQQFNDAGSKEYTAQLDYVQPLKKLNIEIGGKAIFRNNYSNFQKSVLDSTSQMFNIDPKATNSFNYSQDVLSFYNSYQIKWTKWTLKAGLRLEHTAINATFSSSPTAVSPDYNNLIPSISIQRQLKSSSINFGYTERIQRPGIWQLNPFVDTSNPLFISTGNTALRPELSHSFELNYSNFSKTAVTAGLSYSFSRNAIQNINQLITTTVNGQDQIATLSTYKNLGSNDNLGLNLSTNFTFSKHLSASINGRIAYVNLKADIDGKDVQNNGITGYSFANAGYKFDSGYRIGLDAGFFSGDVNIQGKTNKFIYTSYVITKEFMNKNASISFVANNPYSKYFSGGSYTKTDTYYQTTYNQNIYRSFAMRLTYKFGKLNSEIKKNQRGINNDDTKGGGKSNGN